MILRTCADCSTQYTVDLAVCPHCGSSNTQEEGTVTRRLPLFVTVTCPACPRGPWTVRMPSILPGLITVPTLACASCGSRVPVTWPPEEEPMSPKITVHGGATNARDADVSPAADASGQPQVTAEDDLGSATPETDETVGEEQATADAGGEDAAALDEADEPTTDPYAGLSLAELRTEADGRGVPSYGSKAQITERLREADAAAEGNSEAE